MRITAPAAEGGSFTMSCDGYTETPALPAKCRECNEDCYNCDYAGGRWLLTQRKSLELKKVLKLKAISRLQREVAEIDRQLAGMEKEATG